MRKPAKRQPAVARETQRKSSNPSVEAFMEPCSYVPARMAHDNSHAPLLLARCGATKCRKATSTSPADCQEIPNTEATQKSTGDGSPAMSCLRFGVAKGVLPNRFFFDPGALAPALAGTVAAVASLS